MREPSQRTGDEASREIDSDATDANAGSGTGRRPFLGLLAGALGAGVAGTASADRGHGERDHDGSHPYDEDPDWENGSRDGRGPPRYNWRRDVDAGGNRLERLGALATASNETAITDFAGENLSIDSDGVLHGAGADPSVATIAEPGDDLQAKVDAAEGGVLRLRPGTYTLPDGPLTIGSNTVVQGSGMNATVLERHPDHTENIVVRNRDLDGDRNIVVRDLAIDADFGPDVTLGDGGSLSLTGENYLLWNVRVSNGRRHNLQACQVIDFTAMHCDFDTAYSDDVVEVIDSDEGFAGSQGASVSENVLFYDCEMHGAKPATYDDPTSGQKWSHGLEVEAGPKSVAVRDCTMYDNVGGDVRIKYPPQGGEEAQPGRLELYGCDLRSPIDDVDNITIGSKVLKVVNCRIPAATIDGPDRFTYRDSLLHSVAVDGGSGTITNCTITSSFSHASGDVSVSDCRFEGAPVRIGSGGATDGVFRDNAFVDVPGGEHAISVTGSGQIDEFLLAGNRWDGSGDGFLADETSGGSQQFRLSNNRAGSEGLVALDDLSLDRVSVVLDGLVRTSLAGGVPDATEHEPGDTVVDTDTGVAYLVTDGTDPSGVVKLGA